MPRPSAGALACLALFAIVSLLVLSGVPEAADVAALQAIASERTPTVTWVMQFLSTVGNWTWEVPLVVLVAVFLWRRGHGERAKRYVISGAAGEAFYGLTKLAFHRPRPSVVTHLGKAGGYSYPSGHSMLAPILWSLGLWLVASELTSRPLRMVCYAVAIGLPLAIGFSRLYLGVHYPTDVVGGLALGLAWVFYWRPAVLASAPPGPR